MSNDAAQIPATAGQSPVELDGVNQRILAELRQNGRISMAALAAKVNISRASAYNRAEWLTSASVIKGFAAVVDTARMGLRISALIYVTVHPQS